MADARLTRPDYVNDHCWEFRSGAGDPPALSFSTTYGLRARQMRLFLGLGRGAEIVTDPARFALPPTLRQVFPNYLRLEFRPFPQMEGGCETWVPDSHSLAGRVRLLNLDDFPHRVRLVLHAALLPGENPEPMHPETVQGVTFLVGRTGDLVPVVFLTGGATCVPAAQPALGVAFTLGPGEDKTLTWAQAALGSLEESLTAARELVSRPWEEEIARLEVLHHTQVEIESGDHGWDFALKMAQQAALASFVGPTPHLPDRSIVWERSPDRGYSARGDGRDHPPGWDGQVPIDVYAIGSLVVHAAPEWAKGLVRNYLAVQAADGSIDNRPGLGGQRGGSLAAPLLASLAWRIFQHTEDRAFLETCFEGLLDFLEAWFTPAHDRDGDGVPEWDHCLQAGFEDWPSFAPWAEWTQGLDLTRAETPDLSSYLHRECLSLIAAAKVLGRQDVANRLGERAERLRAAVEASWTDQTRCYHHRDRDLHVSPEGTLLGEGVGDFTLRLEQRFSVPGRIVICCRGPQARAQDLSVTIQGQPAQGRSVRERLTNGDMRWFWGRGSATSEHGYVMVREIRVRGLSPEFHTRVFAADFRRQDVTLLLPLWAGIPEEDRAQRLIQSTLLDPQRFWRPFGVPGAAATDPAYAASHRSGAGAVHMAWNGMLGEGLLAYGRRAEAAELVRRLMVAATDSLQGSGGFHRWYGAENGEGFGGRDHPVGLPPLLFFLSCLGVHLIAPQKIRLEGWNPFPWPVTVRWRGLEVRREVGDGVVITFPDGERIEVTGPEAKLIEQVSRKKTS